MIVEGLGGKSFFHPKSGRILKQFVHPRGYHSVELYCGSKTSRKSKWVHRLVCEAFNGPSEGQPSVLHADGNPSNNHASNLRWGTQADNAADSIRHGVIGRGESHSQVKLTDAAVRELRRLFRSGEMSSLDLAAKFGISRSHVYTLNSEKQRAETA